MGHVLQLRKEALPMYLELKAVRRFQTTLLAEWALVTFQWVLRELTQKTHRLAKRHREVNMVETKRDQKKETI